MKRRKGATMVKTLRGVIRGRTIELAEDPGVADGQQVEITLKIVPPARLWGEGILRTAGVLADDPEWDDIMEEIYRQRRGLFGSDPRSEEATTQ
jgi:hypothetical protein